jgi:hypothetical protein
MGFGELDKRALEEARRAGRPPPQRGVVPRYTPPPHEPQRHDRSAEEARRRRSDHSRIRADQMITDHDREAARRTGIAIGVGVTVVSAAAGLWLILSDRTPGRSASTPTPPVAGPAPAPTPAPEPVIALSGAPSPSPGVPTLAYPILEPARPADRVAIYRDLMGSVDVVLHGIRFTSSGPLAEWPAWLPPEAAQTRLTAARAAARAADPPDALDRAVLAYVDVVERDLPAWTAAAALRVDPASAGEAAIAQAPLSEAFGAVSLAVRAALPPPPTTGDPYLVALDVCRAGVAQIASSPTTVSAVVERLPGDEGTAFGAPLSADALDAAARACIDAVLTADRAHPGGEYLRSLLFGIGDALLTLRDSVRAGGGVVPTHLAQLSLYATRKLESLRR